MIYELEKLELNGVSWLNYYTLGLIGTIFSLVAAIILFLLLSLNSTYTDSKDDQNNDNILLDAAAFFLSSFIICGFITLLMSTGIGEYTTHKVPLSTIGDKITVQGEKVVIDKFDEPYGYESLTEKKDESNPKSDTEQIFKFEYNELYESGKLITEKGSYYKLSKADVRYLKERGVR